MTQEETATTNAKRELITFYVGDQDFCMDIMLIREIRGWTNVTSLPHAPTDVLGVMNLRGAVVPIVDLSRRLGFGPCEPKERNVIIIANIGSQTIGFLVTAVSDIVSVLPKDIQPMPDAGGQHAGTLVEGIIVTEDRTLRALSADALGATIDQKEVA